MKYISLLKKSLALALLIVTTQSFSQSLTPLTIGTINAGDSVVIYYDVTINTGAGAQVTNQGTISGSNFTTFVTDDPDTGPANDPTITLLNVFPLPVRLLELKAQASMGVITVSWNVSNEENMIRYEIEKSTNGRTFTKIGEVAALNRLIPSLYNFSDQNPVNGINYYRLRMIDQTSAKFSSIVRVDLDGKQNSITVFPNPAAQNITLQLSNMQKGTYELLLYTNTGQVAFKRSVYHDGGSSSKSITLPNGLTRGVYNVLIRTDKKVHSQLLMIQ